MPQFRRKSQPVEAQRALEEDTLQSPEGQALQVGEWLVQEGDQTSVLSHDKFVAQFDPVDAQGVALLSGQKVAAPAPPPPPVTAVPAPPSSFVPKLPDPQTLVHAARPQAPTLPALPVPQPALANREAAAQPAPLPPEIPGASQSKPSEPAS
jgi:hypothetical protein